MSNSMEVDSDARPQILGSPFTLKLPAVASPHPSQQGEMVELNMLMNDVEWVGRFQRAEDDRKKQIKVFVQILVNLATELKSIEISSGQAEKLLESLDEKGIKEWQNGVDAGIKGDWTQLASHRRFYFISY